MAETLQISLKAARANVNLTQDDVCREMHITKKTLGNWETGKVKIPFISLYALSNFYKIPIDNICVQSEVT